MNRDNPLRFAFVTGIPASGKSELVKSLVAEHKDQLHVFYGDHVRHWASVRLCPYLDGPRAPFDDHLWNKLFEHCDVDQAVYMTLKDIYSQQIKNPLPMVMEATICADPRFRDAVTRGLERLDVPTITKFFWIDQPAELNRTWQNGRQKESRPWRI